MRVTDLNLCDMPIPDLDRVIAEHYPEFDGVHPACLAVPMIDLAGFERITEHIRQHGLLEPLLRTKGRLLLDGKVRLLACFVAGQDIRIEDDPGIDDPWEIVNTLNILRKSLNYLDRRQFQHRMVNQPAGATDES